MPVHAITGCMFSGKSEELCRRLMRFLIAKKKICVFVPRRDIRKARSLNRLLQKLLPESSTVKVPDTIPVRSPSEMLRLVRDVQVIAVDEAQFFSKRQTKKFLDFLMGAKQGRTVIVAGLDTDFLHRPFGVMPAVLAVADEVLKLTAVCEKCGDDKASYTQRLVGGKPARVDSPLVVIGDKDSYEPRCEKCFEIG